MASPIANPITGSLQIFKLISIYLKKFSSIFGGIQNKFAKISEMRIWYFFTLFTRYSLSSHLNCWTCNVSAVLLSDILLVESFDQSKTFREFLTVSIYIYIYMCVCVCVCLCVCVYVTSPHEQDVTQGQSSSGV